MIFRGVFGNRRIFFTWLGSLLIIYMAIYFALRASKEMFSCRLLMKGFYGKEYVYEYNAEKLNEKVIQDYFDMKEYLNLRKYFNLSRLGEHLFLDKELPPKQEKTYKILIWKYGKKIEPRHLYYYTETRHDPFTNCSVSNCILDYNDSSAADADAVVVLLHRLGGARSLPSGTRPAGQRWVFLTDESPLNTFNRGHVKLSELAGLFNWSMSYKAESDVPVPYGRTVPLRDPVPIDEIWDFKIKFEALVPNAKKKRRDVLVAIMMSNCRAKNKRLKYVTELQKYMKVDFYGRCSKSVLKNACPGNYRNDCPLLDDYLFYLAFENSNCDQYITEKIFSHGYKNGAVPIIMGSRNEINFRLLPPHSYLNVHDFKSPKDLADRLWFINATLEDSYWKLHEWRKNLEVLNEHGYLNSSSVHYCRVCEALNYNDEAPKVYGLDDLKHFLDSGPKYCYNKALNSI